MQNDNVEIDSAYFIHKSLPSSLSISHIHTLNVCYSNSVAANAIITNRII